MLRSLLLVCAFVAVVGLVQESSAFTISRNNPYRSFNVTGYNYGSMQWELSHGKKGKSASPWKRGRRFFRR